MKRKTKIISAFEMHEEEIRIEQGILLREKEM